jgi:hypothetical protein
MLRHAVLFGLFLVLSALPGGAQPDQWKAIFNGEGITGWEHVGPGGFELESSLLKPHGGMGLLLYTREKIGNAVIRVVFKPVQDSSNSGVFIRIPEKPTESWMPVNRGYEVQIDNADDDYHCTGVLYSLTKAMARPQKAGEWNTMEITLDGLHTIVVLNAVKITDYTEGQSVPPKRKSYEPDRGPRPNEGYIGLQNHSDKDIVYFKEVALKKLNP